MVSGTWYNMKVTNYNFHILSFYDILYLLYWWIILDYHAQPTLDTAHIEHENHNVDQSRGQLQAWEAW